MQKIGLNNTIPNLLNSIVANVSQIYLVLRLIYKLKLKQETMEHNRIKRFNENSELNISDVRNSDFDEISDEILRYFEKLGDAKSRNKEELDDELKKIISSELKKVFDFFYS